MEPGYSASAGAHAIGAQIRLRPGDPDGEPKARAVIGSSAAHEKFHALIGETGRGWPAWVNESLASHFAIEASRRFLAPVDFAWVERFHSDEGVTMPVLAAQAAYSAGGQEDARSVFYGRGARFWREIEAVLHSRANPSGRLGALIQDSRGFAGVDLSDARAIAEFLDRHSKGRAGPIVRCHLLGEACVGGPSG